MRDVLEKTFGQMKVIKYLMFQNLIGNLPKEHLLSYLSRYFDHFQIIQVFDQYNKSKVSWTITGLIMTPRIKLFNIQQIIFNKCNEKIDLVVLMGIFGIQLLLQTSLILAFIDKWTWLVFLGIFSLQVFLFLCSVTLAGFYCVAREISDQW